MASSTIVENENHRKDITMFDSEFQQSDDQQKIADMDKLFFACAEDKLILNTEWDECNSFYKGDQYVYIDTTAGAKSTELRRYTKTNWRIVVNRIKVTIDTAVSMVLKDNRKLQGIAKDFSSESINAARMTGKMLQHVDNVNQGKFHNINLLTKSFIYGTVFEKKFFNSTRKANIKLQNYGILKDAPVGEIEKIIVLPYQMFIPKNVEFLEKAPYFFHATMRDIKYVKNVYGIVVSPEDIVNADTEKQLDYVDRGAFEKREQDYFDIEAGQVIIKEYWERISENNYTVVTYCKNKILDVKTEVPMLFDVLRCNPATGKFWGVGMVKYLIDVQRMINNVWNAIIMQLRFAVKNGVLSPRGTNLSPIKHEEYGALYEYDIQPDGSKPERFDTQLIPQVYLMLLALLYDEMNKIPGIHDISKGVASGGRKTAREAMLLSEADTTRIGNFSEVWYEFSRSSAEKILCLAQEYYDYTRLAQVSGDVTEAVYFSKTDLMNVNNIAVIDAPLFADDKMSRFNIALGMYGAGKIDKTSFYDLTDVLSLSNENIEYRQARKQSEFENLSFSQGKIPKTVMPRPFEDHVTHISFHNRFRNSDEYLNLQDFIKRIVDNHVLMHSQVMLQQKMSLSMVMNPTVPATKPNQPIPNAPPKQLNAGPTTVANNQATGGNLNNKIQGIAKPQLTPQGV